LREHIAVTGWWGAAAAWLAILSVFALSHGLAGLQPLNAITGTPIDEDVARLEFKWYALVFEPLFALAQMVIGAPDYRMGLVPWLVWITVIAAILSYLAADRGDAGLFRRFCHSMIVVLKTASVYVAYFLLIATVHIPLWRLAANGQQVVALDFHSHTLSSYDAIATFADNNAYHAGNGYAAFAITDHHSPGRVPIRRAADVNATGELIFGDEISISLNHDRNNVLLLLSADEQVVSSYRLPAWRPGENNLKAAIADAHRRGMATIAVAYQLTPEDVPEFLEAGVDGFEIANFGHPDASPEAQALIRAIYQRKECVVVADTDWHGWTGISRTWTLYHPNGREEHLAAGIVEALKRRDVTAFTPVVSQPFAGIAPLRAMLSPLFDVWRYAAELSPIRLLSWWTWAAVLLVAHRYARERSRARMRVATMRLGDILGVMLLLRGATLLMTGVSAAHSLVTNAGLLILCAGLAVPVVWRMPVGTTKKAAQGRDLLPCEIDTGDVGSA
jgi:hypothetical protein